jgi:prepilin-type N-terminal cleavage/methylation domain-containing protein
VALLSCPDAGGEDCRDAGLTLIEVMVVLVLASILMTIGILAMKNYLMSHRQLGTADGIRSTLRAAGEQSLSEGRTYCVYFTASTWTVYRSDCTVAANKTGGPEKVQDPSITVSAVTFTPPASAVPGQSTACPVTGKCAYFYPRGTALKGSLQVVRGSKTYTVSVEGLTSRVSLA